MDEASLTQILAEFFMDGFREDPAGVGDWLTQSGNDPNEIIPLIEALSRAKP